MNGTPAAPGSGQPATARSQWLVPGIALAAALSAITGIVSYKHGLDVARSTGNAGLVAYLIPLVPDLMIAMSSVSRACAGLELTGSLGLTDITIAGQRLCDAAGGASRKIHWPGRNLTRRK
jgi:hypothetical protein